MKVDQGTGHGIVTTTPPEPVVYRGPEPSTGTSWLRWTEGLGTENPPVKKKRASRAPRRAKTSRLAASSPERQEERTERTEPRRIHRNQRHSRSQETALVRSTAGRRGSKAACAGDALYHHRNDLDFQEWTRDGLPLHTPQDAAATISTYMDVPSTLQPFVGTHNPHYVNTGLYFWRNFAMPLLYTTRLASLDDAERKLMTGIDDDWEVHMRGLKAILNVVGGMSALGRASAKVLSEFRMMGIEGSIAAGKAPMLPFSRIYDALDLQLPTSLSDLVFVQTQLEECYVDTRTIRTITTSYALIKASRHTKQFSSSGKTFVVRCKPEELMEEFASIQYELVCHPDPSFLRRHCCHPGAYVR
ncbi:uncharacterized protein PG986_002477 [Apiospora aurea]|uniref:Uncharacterized protein n=1 Tax=Apiospora aurea TaxID=335848 RepID=A0ABR1QNY6_9PEZI